MSDLLDDENKIVEFYLVLFCVFEKIEFSCIIFDWFEVVDYLVEFKNGKLKVYFGVLVDFDLVCL